MIDIDGVRVVEYTYDAWDKPQETFGQLAATLGRDNPFRYRGYVWDEETGLYVTATRYYNPEWGRWLNADVLLGKTGVLISHNIFAYCINNPVNLRDSTGQAPKSAFTPEEEATMLAITPGPNGLELMSKDRIDFLFGENLYDVEVTDLISNKTFTLMNWDPNGVYHSDPRFPGDDEGASLATARSILSTDPETDWDKPDSWSKDARPCSVTVTDMFGIKRQIAAGIVLFPHHVEYKNFGQDGEMCMFYGFNKRGWARDHGNEAAMNAYNGILSIVKKRAPGSKK